MKKLLIIGLDGATFDLINPWIREGKLPNIARIMREGTSGDLQSIIHPNTPSAWTSLITGKNPGKHGLFDFRMMRPDSYELEFTSSQDRVGESLWDILSQNHKTVGAINIPLSYPPDKINGFMITGMHTPVLEKGVYPPELYYEIRKKFPNYRIDAMSFWYHSYDPFLEDVHRMLRARVELSKYLYQKSCPDCFMVVFVAMDRIQHALWKHMNLENSQYKDEIYRIYERCDEVIGDLAGLADQETTVMLVSDHGFGPLDKDVYLNNFLSKLGLIRFKGNKSSFPTVDWSKTKAYSHGFFGNIFINLKGREPQGIVKEGRQYQRLREYLVERLYELSDPEDNLKIVDRIYRSEELYQGEMLERAPDLIVVMRNYSYMTRDGSEFERETIVSPPLVNHTGNHRMNGILCIKGKDIKKNHEIYQADILDIAPTALYLMGLPVPEDMDGKVLCSAFEEKYISRNPVSYVAGEKRRKDIRRRGEVYSKDESEKIKERLRRLGYLS